MSADRCPGLSPERRRPGGCPGGVPPPPPGAQARRRRSTPGGMVAAMKVFAVLLLLAACSRDATPPVTETMDTREPTGVLYVGSPELPVHAEPNEQSELLATYTNGEAVSVLSEKAEWVEVRTGNRAGWAKRAQLTTAAEKDESEANPTPKFRIMPLPVSAPAAHGEIYIEANVNTDGEVTSTRMLSNTTGSTALADQNAAALHSARFYPIIRKGERQPFKYYHRVTY